jgi:putative zinc finger/helix-turn-helix YgiT family protein
MSKRGGRLRQVSRQCPSCGHRMRRTLRDHYRYVESGLSNVFLNGVAVYECQCSEEMLELPRVNVLHTLIAQKLLTKSAPLDGPELRFVRKFVGLKAVELAEMLRVSPVTVSRWETGEEKIGKTNDQLFRFRMVMKVVEERKAEAEAAYRQIADGYLDLLNEIAALKTVEDPHNAPVNIEAEELDSTRLILRRFDMPDVIVDLAEPLPA